MTVRKPPRLGLIWAQFAAYHVDRCEAVARRLAGRAEVIGIEIATTSADYAWEPSGPIDGAEKVTLFPGLSFDDVAPWRRFAALLRASRRCDVVCIGLSYGLVDVILLSWTLRLLGRRVIVFNDSKFDDMPRSVGFELLKSAVLCCYQGAVVGGRRHMEYLRFLGFKKRPVLPGYDVVGVERIRAQAAGAQAAGSPGFAERPFLFVGRFVDKKNLPTLLRGYARYVALAGGAPRRLRLVGAGPEEQGLRDLARRLDVAELVDFPGFLPAAEISRVLAEAVALVLVSREEQWGLVVNEALAVGLPVIVSHEVGSRDLLVRNLANGFVVDSNCPESIGRALASVASGEAAWHAMREAAEARAWMGDAGRLADAIESLVFPDSLEAQARIGELLAQMEITSQ